MGLWALVLGVGLMGMGVGLAIGLRVSRPRPDECPYECPTVRRYRLIREESDAVIGSLFAETERLARQLVLQSRCDETATIGNSQV
jgi:hypothetical protein